MNKQEALEKLHDLALSVKDSNLKKQLQQIDVALLPNPNYFVIPNFKDRCHEIINHHELNAPLIAVKSLNDLINSIITWDINLDDKDQKWTELENKIKFELSQTYIWLMTIKLYFRFSENEIGHKIDENLTKTINQINNT